MIPAFLSGITGIGSLWVRASIFPALSNPKRGCPEKVARREAYFRGSSDRKNLNQRDAFIKKTVFRASGSRRIAIQAKKRILLTQIFPGGWVFTWSACFPALQQCSASEACGATLGVKQSF